MVISQTLVIVVVGIDHGFLACFSKILIEI